MADRLADPREPAGREEGKEVFFYAASDDYEATQPIEGDTIWSEQLARSHAKKFPDFAAAKAAQGL